MAVQKMWMCTGQLGAWVPCPTSPLVASAEGNSTDSRLLNGGSFVKRSVATRREYNMGWVGTTIDLQPVKDMYSGIYGAGPFYFIDPSNIHNALPPHWAAPQLSGGIGWPSLVKGVNPTLAATAIASSTTPPPLQATYALPVTAPTFTATTPRILLPIPPTQNLNMRFWGSVTGTARIRVNAYNRTTGALTTTDVTPTGTGTLVSFSGATYSHAEVWITKTSTATSTITLAAMLALVSTGTTTPLTWTGGQGHSGVQWATELSQNVYRTWGNGWQALNASMVEVGTWLQ